MVAAERIKELGKFMGMVKLEVVEEGAEIIVDGKLLGGTPMNVFFLETGDHDIAIRKDGFFDSKLKKESDVAKMYDTCKGLGGIYEK